MKIDEIVNPDLTKDFDIASYVKHLEEYSPEEDYSPIGDWAPIVVVKKSSYTEAHKLAQQRYRERYPEKYCESQRKLYEKKKDDPEWKAKFNERSKKNNAIYRQKKKEEKIASGETIKPRGRPRKIDKIN